MTLMRVYGFSEAEVRAHSPAWVHAQVEALTRRRKHDLADSAIAIYQATAAGMGSYEEAGADLQQFIEKLRAEVDASADYFSDPNAKLDLEAVRASGMLKN